MNDNDNDTTTTGEQWKHNMERSNKTRLMFKPDGKRLEPGHVTIDEISNGTFEVYTHGKDTGGELTKEEVETCPEALRTAANLMEEEF